LERGSGTLLIHATKILRESGEKAGVDMMNLRVESRKADGTTPPVRYGTTFQKETCLKKNEKSKIVKLARRLF